VTIVDTAGTRLIPSDIVEAEGIARAQAARRVASVVVLVLDGSQPLTEDDRALLAETAGSPRLVLANKSDLHRAWPLEEIQAYTLRLSALTGEGLSDFRKALLSVIGAGDTPRDVPAITNLRHIELLTRAREALDRAQTAASAEAPEEFVLADLSEARKLLEEVTGTRSADDLLAHIFANFCIGK